MIRVLTGIKRADTERRCVGDNEVECGFYAAFEIGERPVCDQHVAATLAETLKRAVAVGKAARGLLPYEL